MASRGSLGGLAQTTAGLVQVFDAAGFDVILIETVGAGQAEVDIARLAHTTLVVEAPGLGDDIQAIKAGILEIADILVVNKADRPGVENTLKALKGALELAHPVQHVFQHHGRVEVVAAPDVPVYNSWIPPILKTVAIEGIGILDVVEEITRHEQHLRQSGEWDTRERSRLESELEAHLQDTLVARFRDQVSEAQYREILEEVFCRRLAPLEAVQMLLNGRAKKA
jgi:LAO/AO transport system kinase